MQKKLYRTTGGRVLGVTSLAPSLEEAQKIAYDTIAKINFPMGFYRHDIGDRLRKF